MSVIQSVSKMSDPFGTAIIYQVTYSDGTVSFVPSDPLNHDCIAVNAWAAAGGVVEGS